MLLIVQLIKGDHAIRALRLKRGRKKDKRLLVIIQVAQNKLYFSGKQRGVNLSYHKGKGRINDTGKKVDGGKILETAGAFSSLGKRGKAGLSFPDP
jgi:hypothetical protein